MINEEKMDNILLELGHDDFSRGTSYIREAVGMYTPGMRIVGELYSAIAAAHDSTPSRVERCMRHSIDKAWSRGSEAARLRYFGWSTSPDRGKPTVSEYVARLTRLCSETEGHA